MSGKTRSLRSALGKVRGLGSAKDGTGHWISLRVTAAVLVPLTLYVLIGFVNNVASGGYSGAVYWLQSPLSAAFTILTLLFGLHHGAAGMREVIDDYIHHAGGRIICLLAVYFLAATLAVLGTLSVAKIFFGV